MFRKSLFFLVFPVLALGGCPPSNAAGPPALIQVPSATSPPGSEAEDGEAITLRVRLFVETWLSRRDIERSLEFFAPSAFSNQSMLQEDCIGILPEWPKTPERIRKGVTRFLRGFARQWRAGQPLSEILGTRGIEALESSDPDESAEDRKWTLRATVNDVGTDRFWILRFEGSEDLTSERWQHLGDRLAGELAGKDFYVSSLPLWNAETGLDGVVALYWIRDAGLWKIYHVSLLCV